MSVTVKLTLTCPTHPRYAGKSKNVRINCFNADDYCDACSEVYNYQRPIWWNDPEWSDPTDVQVKIEEVKNA